MKEFDLKQAKKGADIITKAGNEAKILYFTRDNDQFPLVVLLDNKHVYYYTTDGRFFHDKHSNKDLKLK